MSEISTEQPTVGRFLDLAGPDTEGEVGEAPLSVGICPDNLDDIELLRDLLVAEHERQTGKLDEATDDTLTNALQMALRRLGEAPPEPLDPAARVIGTSEPSVEPGVELGVEYAKVGDVWVSHVGAATWAQLIVEYDELTVHGLHGGGSS